MIAFLLLLALSAVAAPVPTVRAFAPASDGASVEFLAIGRPAAIRIVGRAEGEGSAPRGDFRVESGQIRGEARFALATLSTGLGLRDEHMKTKYLEVEKYPEARLALDALPESALSTGASVPFGGRLTLHGVEKPVTGQATLRPREGGGYTVEARFPVALADHGIAVPKFAGVTVAETVDVTVKFVGAPVAAAPAGK